MISPKAQLSIWRIVGRRAQQRGGEVTADTLLGPGGLHLDSLDIWSMVVEIEAALDTEFTDDQVEHLHAEAATVQTLLDIAAEATQADDAAAAGVPQ